jgi:hypothetical protein
LQDVARARDVDVGRVFCRLLVTFLDHRFEVDRPLGEPPQRLLERNPALRPGQGAGVDEQLGYLEEMNRLRVPGPVNVIGVSNIAPAMMQFGTPEQQARFLRPMLRGDEIWSQCVSEPDAGSLGVRFPNSRTTQARRRGVDGLGNLRAGRADQVFKARPMSWSFR